MRVDWTLVTGPQQEPIALAEAKKEARVETDDDNDRISEYIKASRIDAEEYLMRGLFTQTWELVLSEWSDEMWLPRAAPLQSVTSVKYYDGAGTLQTLATTVYDVKSESEPARIVRKPNQVWPTLQSDKVGAVIITYLVGWTAVASIPASIRHGIALLVNGRVERQTGKAWQDTRDAAMACWAPHRIWMRPLICADA